MAYQWRRSFNGGPLDGGDTITYEMSTLAANETHRSCWWQFTFFTSWQGETYDVGASVVKAGLIYGAPGVAPPDPLNDPFADWIDQVQISLHPSFSRLTTDVNWFAYGDMGPLGRKAKSMRRNDTGSDLSLYLSMHAWGINSGAGWTDAALVSISTDTLISGVAP